MKRSIALLACLVYGVFLFGQITKGTGIIYFDNTPNVNATTPYGSELAFSITQKSLYRWDRDSLQWYEVADPDQVTGSGTLNYLPKWTPDGSTLGNSILVDDGTNVGIDIPSPAYRLDVVTGGIRLQGQSTSPAGAAGVIYYDTDEDWFYGHDGVGFELFAKNSDLYTDPDAQATTGWVDNGSYISLVTSSDEVRIGATSDRGDYDLQVKDGIHVFSGGIDINGGNFEILSASGRVFADNGNVNGAIGNFKNSFASGSPLYTKGGWPTVITADGSNAALRVGPDQAVSTNYRKAIELMPASAWNASPTNGIGTDGGLGIEWKFKDSNPTEKTLARIAGMLRDAGAGGVVWDGSLEFSVIIDHALVEVMRLFNGHVGIGNTNPLYRLDMTTGGLRLAGQSTAPTGAAGVLYQDSDDDRLYHHNGIEYGKLAYQTEVPTMARGELYRNNFTDTINIEATQDPQSLLFESIGITQGITTTDSTLTITEDGDYLITFSSTFFWVVGGTLAGEPASFLLYVDDVLINEGASFIQNSKGINLYHSSAFSKRVNLSNGEVLKIKITGGGSNNRIKVLRAVFDVHKIQ